MYASLVARTKGARVVSIDLLRKAAVPGFMALVFVTLLKSLSRVCVCVYEKKGKTGKGKSGGSSRDRGLFFVTAHFLLRSKMRSNIHPETYRPFGNGGR